MTFEETLTWIDPDIRIPPLRDAMDPIKVKSRKKQNTLLPILNIFAFIRILKCHVIADLKNEYTTVLILNYKKYVFSIYPGLAIGTNKIHELEKNFLTSNGQVINSQFVLGPQHTGIIDVELIRLESILLPIEPPELQEPLEQGLAPEQGLAEEESDIPEKFEKFDDVDPHIFDDLDYESDGALDSFQFPNTDESFDSVVFDERGNVRTGTGGKLTKKRKNKKLYYGSRRKFRSSGKRNKKSN